MTKIYSELFENADPNKALNSYKTNGAFVLKKVFNKIEINNLRNKLDTLFSNDGDQRIRNLKESNSEDLEFYLNYFYNQNLLDFFNQVFNNNKNKNKTTFYLNAFCKKLFTSFKIYQNRWLA